MTTSGTALYTVGAFVLSHAPSHTHKRWSHPKLTGLRGGPTSLRLYGARGRSLHGLARSGHSKTICRDGWRTRHGAGRQLARCQRAASVGPERGRKAHAGPPPRQREPPDRRSSCRAPTRRGAPPPRRHSVRPGRPPRAARDCARANEGARLSELWDKVRASRAVGRASRSGRVDGSRRCAPSWTSDG